MRLPSFQIPNIDRDNVIKAIARTIFLLFDDKIKVPLLFVGSSINPQIIKKQARHVDICSTIYDLLGITVINEKSGESLRFRIIRLRLN